MSDRHEDSMRERDSDSPGLGLLVGLVVFLLIVGLIGWHTRPVPVAYSHSCRRYEPDDEEDWEEGYEPDNKRRAVAKPASKAVVKAGTGLKTDKNLNQASQDAIKAAIAKRMNKRTAKPAAPPKPPAVTKSAAVRPPPKKEHFQAADAKKKAAAAPASEVKAVRVTAL